MISDALGATADQARRRFPRYRADMTIAVLFDPDDRRPTVHAIAADASAGGIAVESHCRDLQGTVTLLVVPGIGFRHNGGRTLRFRARVVWHREVRGRLFGRRHVHGLQFLGYGSDDAHEFARHLARACSPLPAPVHHPGLSLHSAAAGLEIAPDGPADAAVAAMPGATSRQACDAALQRGYEYLAGFAAEQEANRTAFPDGRYRLVRVPPFVGLKWRTGRAFLGTRETPDGERTAHELCFRYELASDAVIELLREVPENDRLRSVLTEHDVRFCAEDRRAGRGLVHSTAFSIPVAVRAVVTIAPASEPALLAVRLTNVGGFGAVQTVALAREIDGSWLDALAGLILGRVRQVPFLSRMPVCNDRSGATDTRPTLALAHR